MKKLCLLAMLFMSVSSIYSQMVISPIGGNLTADSSAIVQINSTNQGFLPPRMTTVQQLAIANPATGLIIFNTDSNQVMVFTDSNWVSVGNGTVWKTNGTHVYNNNAGFVGIGTSTPTSKLSIQDSIIAPLFPGAYQRSSQKIDHHIAFAPYSNLGTQSSSGLEIEARAANLNIPSNADLVGLNVSSDQDGIRVNSNLGGTALRASAFMGKAIIVGDGNSGLGVDDPKQKLEVNGGLKLGIANNTTLEDGTIQYTAANGFQFRHNNSWQSLDSNSSFWTLNGNHILNTNSGNVGIGVSNPMNKLSASDNNTVVKIHKKSSSTGINYIDDSYKPGMEIFVDSNTINNSSIVQTGSALTINNVRGSALQAISKYGISSYAADGAAGIFTNNSSSPVLLTLGGNVGFGITNPFQKLEIDGAFKLGDTSTTGLTNNGVIRYNPTEGFQGKHNNDWQSLSSPWEKNNNDIINSNTGNVGIGVSNPMNKLSASDNNTVVKIHKKSSSTGINYLDDSYKPGMEIFVDSNTINNSSIVQTGSALTINNVRGSALQAISKYGISSYAADGAAGIFSNNSSSPVLLTLGGNVGFGITNPFQKLEIDGAFKLGDTSTTALTNNGVIRYNPTEGFQGKHNNDWQSLSSPWVKNNNDIINSNTGNVGIGVSNPMNKLSASDNNTVVKIHKKSSSTGINYIDDSYKPGMEIFVDSNTINNSSIVQTGSALTINNVRGSALQAISKYGISSYAADGAAGIFSNNSSSPVLLTLGGNVGFGITNPFQKLEIDGAFKLGDTSTMALTNNGVIRYNPTEGFQGKHNNDWQSLSSPWVKNNNDIINSNTGNVGIGVSNPMNKLSASDNNTVVKIHKKSSSTGINYIDDSYKPGMEIFVDSNTINNSSIVQTGSALTINNVRGSALQAISKYGISSYAADGAAGIFSNNSSSPVLLTLGGNVGFGITNPFQKLEIDGAFKLGDTSTTGLTNNGVIRYNPTEGFQGKHNNIWKNLLGDDKFGKSANHVYVLNDTTGTFSVGSTTTLPTTKMTVLGTTSDPIPLYLSPATSAAPALITGGRIGANTLSPDVTSALDVNGTIVIRGGSPGTGKVLTSDINGKASWQTPTPIGYTAGTGININSGVISTNLVAGSGITITGNTISTNTSSGGGWTEASGNIYQNNPFANGTITVGTDVPATDARMKILGNTSLPIGLRLSSGLANPANGIALSAVGRLRVNANNAREDIETGGAIVVGGAAVSTTPAEGTIQYAGTDLQGYVGGQWKSLTATGSGGSSPWTVSGNDISNSNTGKVLMGSATGTTSAKVEVADNTSFAKVMSVSNNGAAYMTVLDVKETSTSGGPIGCDVCSGTAAIKSIATKGDALYASSATRGMYVKGGDAFYPAIVVENNSSSNVSIDLAKQIQIRGGNPGAGKVLTSDANGLATWQTPSGGSGSGWNTTGNSGLNNTNFIGNTDAVDLNFKTNNANGLTLTSGGALLATGSTSTGTTPATGAGSRMMWIPAKGAFRAGTVTGTHWNDIQLASYSTAFGYNTIAGGNYSFAVGNTASATGFTSFAIGDNVSASGSRSIAIGSNVNAGFQGAFCFGDMDFSNTLLASTTNQMNMRFSGGYRLFSNSASTIGVQLTAGGNSWSTISDRRKKENLKSVDGESFLKSIANMPLSSWNYIGQDKSQHRHYGPMAQDFFAAFGHDGIGTIGNDTTIAAADMDGVSFIAIQALEKRTTSLQAENRDLKTQNEALQKELLALRNDLNIVMTKINESSPKKSTTEESTTANLSTK